jgi:anti-anti-sigma regulatory factor/anti-sigma regulatory factor (Ser/Thr protein kinase)
MGTARWTIAGPVHLWTATPQAAAGLRQLVPPALGLAVTDVVVDLRQAGTMEPFAVAALAAQVQRLRALGYGVEVALDPGVPSNTFADALGLRTFPQAPQAAEPRRTVALRTLRGYVDLERFAKDVSQRVASDDPEVEQATKYTLVELLRNVFDHSGSTPVVVAQLMHAGKGQRVRESVQVTVADAGRGLRATLAPTHTWVTTDSTALNAAFSPFISRTFPEGRYSEMKDNAGLGLHFVSELVKRSNGRLLVWSGTRARIVIGTPDDDAPQAFKETEAELPALTGTLAVVEFELGLIEDYMSFFAHLREQVFKLIDVGQKGVTVLERATNAPPGTPTFAVRDVAEDTMAARRLRQETLLPAARANAAVALDFEGYEALSPSFAHALVHELLREVALRGGRLHVLGVRDPVWDALLQVQRYALAGPSHGARGTPSAP